jgi:ankyrin repeat protein
LAIIGISECDICNVSDSGNTPLHHFIAKKLELAARAVIENGAAVDAINRKQQTPLHLALDNSLHSLVAKLLHVGADPNTCNNDAMAEPLLYRVTKLASVSLIQHALDAGADPNRACSDGSTALHLAAMRGAYHHCGLLLARGADSSLKDASGETALHTARGVNVVKLLTCNVHMIDETNIRGETALYQAVANKRFDVAQALLARGASVNIQTCTGATALHCAAKYQQLGMVSLLLQYGADVTRKTVCERRQV